RARDRGAATLSRHRLDGYAGSDTRPRARRARRSARGHAGVNREATLDLARRGELYPAVILHGGREDARRETAPAPPRPLLCERAPDERPCGACKHCRRIAWPGGKTEPFHPDFLVLERDLRTSTSVEAARTLLQAAQVTPFEARGQVFVIAAAD